jgi:D-sedoheptulose 7-phosphate isomerase
MRLGISAVVKVIGLTRAKGGEVANLVDTVVKVPETYMVQELHQLVYRCRCLMLEEKFFGGK